MELYGRTTKQEATRNDTIVHNMQLKSCQVSLPRTLKQRTKTIGNPAILLNNKKGWRRIALWKTMTHNIVVLL